MVLFGLRLGGSTKAVHAELWSNELEQGSDRILLLSLKAQGTLGLCKNVRRGTCYLEDYDQYVPLYEVIGSDLRAICISDTHLAPASPVSETERTDAERRTESA